MRAEHVRAVVMAVVSVRCGMPVMSSCVSVMSSCVSVMLRGMLVVNRGRLRVNGKRQRHDGADQERDPQTRRQVQHWTIIVGSTPRASTCSFSGAPRLATLFFFAAHFRGTAVT